MKTKLLAGASIVLIIALLVAIVGLPYGRLSPAAFAELYHGGEDTTGYVHFAIDCYPSTAATEDDCIYPFGTPALDVSVTVSNSTGAAYQLAAFNFLVHTPDAMILNPPVINNTGDLDDNPDFDQATITGTWQCSPPAPTPDFYPSVMGMQSLLSCYNGSGDGPTLPADSPSLNTPLARLHYNVAFIGVVPLTLDFVAAYDDTFSEIGSCRPLITTAGLCFDATVRVLNIGDCTPGDNDCDLFADAPSSSHAAPFNTNQAQDNCPGSASNNTQANSDGNFVDQSPPYVPGVDDRTLVNSDGDGTYCDEDWDNDGIRNTVEVTGLTCGGASDPLKLDTDGDRAHDGAECVFGTQLTNPASKPPVPAPADDPDNDRLHSMFEGTIGTNPNDADTDDDGLQDGWEYLGYGSDPLVAGDGDATQDACEAASINADSVVNPGDQALLSAEIIRPVPPAAKIANMDLNKDGVINPGDQAWQSSMTLPGKCPLV